MEIYMKKAWKVVVFFGLALFCNSCWAGDLVGKNAPEITIREWITSDPPDVKNLQDRVYVVEFWATWCAPCRENVPHLIKLADKYRENGVLFIALSADKSADTVRKFVRKKGINYNVAIDNGSADIFAITGYPTAFVVNHKGKVVWQGIPRENKFEDAINKAIKDAQPPLVAKDI
jgi:thiol-disulfide isomerase/thioredoxin